MVYGKAEVFKRELETLTDPGAWRTMLGKIEPELQRPFAEAIQILTLLRAGDYEARIMQGIVSKFPQKLLLIAKRGKHVQCPERLAVVQEITTARPATLEITSLKLLQIFPSELLEVVKTGGKCPGTLWSWIALWAENGAWPSDTHYIEGLNNMIIAAALAAPRMKDPLQSARLVGQCALLPEDGPRSTKLRDVDPLINAVVTTASVFYKEAQTIMEDLYRYTCPAPVAKLPEPTRPAVPLKFNASTLAWARHYNAKFVMQQRKSNTWAMRSLLVLPFRAGQRCFACPFLHGWVWATSRMQGRTLRGRQCGGAHAPATMV